MKDPQGAVIAPALAPRATWINGVMPVILPSLKTKPVADNGPRANVMGRRIMKPSPDGLNRRNCYPVGYWSCAYFSYDNRCKAL